MLRQHIPPQNVSSSPLVDAESSHDKTQADRPKAHPLNDSQVPDLAAFGELIHAIGTAHFERLLFATVSVHVNIDHYAIVTFATDETPHYVAGHGKIAPNDFAEITRCYEAELFRLDPCVPKIMSRKGETRPVSFDFDGGAGYLPFYRRKLMDAVGISDKHSFAFWREKTGYYVNFYCTQDRKFTDDEKRFLDRLSSILAAPIARHFSFLPRIPQGASNFLERVLNASPLFETTTAREKAVCLGILGGHTSESIGLHLNISRNTVLTYRKRLYEKLSICSQHELFMLFIKSAQTFDRPSSTHTIEPFATDHSVEWVDGFA